MGENEPNPKRMTDLAHELIEQAITRGDTVVDATAGNGHDTVFLRRCVGSAGKVYAIDIQACALQLTRSRLEHTCEADTSNVALIHGCHSNLQHLLPPETRGRVTCVMFNLGYLPGTDHAVTTLPSTTEHAMTAALRLLKAGGIMTVAVYTGHQGGKEELEVVCNLAGGHRFAGITWNHYMSQQLPDTAPQLFVARKMPAC